MPLSNTISAVTIRIPMFHCRKQQVCDNEHASIPIVIHIIEPQHSRPDLCHPIIEFSVAEQVLHVIAVGTLPPELCTSFALSANCPCWAIFSITINETISEVTGTPAPTELGEGERATLIVLVRFGVFN